MKTATVLRLLSLVTLIVTLLSGCVAPTPQTIEKVVEKQVVVTQQVEKVVTQQVEKVVEKPVVVTATPLPKGGTLTYGLLFSPSAIDPHVGSSWDSGAAVANVYDPLVNADANGNPVPGLAQSWTISDDGKTITFKLRQGVKFHDGTPFNAAAVKFSFDRIVDPKTKSSFAVNLLGPYKATEVVDDTTAKVTLSEAFAPFLANLSLPYVAMVSPTAVAKWGADYQMHQVGTGPFMMKEYVLNQQLVLVKNPDYNWPPASAKHQGAAYLDQVIFKFVPDTTARAKALQAGDLDVARELSPEQAPRLAQDPNFSLKVTAMPGQTMQFFMNTQKSPTDDLKVRQALLYAVDSRVAANTIFQGYFPVAYGPLAQNTLGYDPTLKDLYPYDPAKAAALLKEAGWVDTNNDGVREKDGKPLTLQVIMQNWGHIQELAQLMQGQLAQVGVKLELQMMSYPAALKAVGDGNYHLSPYGGGGWDPSVLRDYFASDAYFNWSKISMPDLDKILAQAGQSLKAEDRVKLYQQAQQIIMKNALILPMLSDGQIVGISNKVKGLTYDPYGLWPNLYDAYIVK
ncbi:MAG: ABC transporter substrate-binding protein [Chloroflexi bacterium]|nr:ABC transporter substrate-binding protein [Chloroflexota bacterium]